MHKRQFQTQVARPKRATQMELYKLSKQQREGRDLQRSSAVKGVKSTDSTRFLQTQHLSTAKGKVLRNIQIDLAAAGSGA